MATFEVAIAFKGIALMGDDAARPKQMGWQWHR
jgi:hypothetical protein